MSGQSNINAQSESTKSSTADNSHLSVQDNMKASEEKEDPIQKGTDVLKSNAKKHKRKLSPNSDNDVPIKVVKIEADLDVNTKSVTVKKKTFNKRTKKEESSVTDLVISKKRSHYHRDDSFLPPTKKIKIKTDGLRHDERRKKQVRRRTKCLLQAVLEQMEFYFGDSNLSKDRYIKKLIDNSPDGYVDLFVFGNFNKLQSLHKDGVSMKVLAAAIKKSKLLQLNDDGSKVKRTTPIKDISQDEIDSRTVYVEHLPTHANHTWIRSTFCQCGKVVYVSLPVYKTTRMIKGFAFVEFETSEEAAKACMLLNNPLPAKSEDKPGMFPKGNKTLNRLQKIAPPNIDQDSNEENIPNNLKTESRHATVGIQNKKKKKKNTKKKKTHDSTSDENSLKPNVTETEQTEQKTEQIEGKKKKKKKKKKQNQPQDGMSNKVKEIKSNMESGVLTTLADVCLTESADVSSVPRCEPMSEDGMNASHAVAESDIKENIDGDGDCEGVKSAVVKTPPEDGGLKKKKNKKKRKGEKKAQDQSKEKVNNQHLQSKKMESSDASDQVKEDKNTEESTEHVDAKLNRKERKRLRQEDIRRKKLEREGVTTEKINSLSMKADEGSDSNNLNSLKDITSSGKQEIPNQKKEDKYMITSDVTDCDLSQRKTDGFELTSILKSRKGQERKKVEFDPVPVTNEFVKGREIRKRRKLKKEKLHLRVITKDEWLTLKAEYIAQQKSHMAALKESLRELRQQENLGKLQGHKRVDLEDVFGTKRLKPSQDLKMAHVESLKFTPNVIVQWKCSHEMHRDKIRTMFKEMSGDSIAYIDAKEEAKFGYIRFKDETSAEEFSKLSRRSASFMARILPADQQEEYWKRANEDRMKKLGRKKHEKGSEKIARKVFERNKATFFQKPNHVVFEDEDVPNETKGVDLKTSNSESRPGESHLQDGDHLAESMDGQVITS